jgi:hypothetical protein
MRSVSSFDVAFGYGTGDTPQGLNNFKLKQVNVYGAPTSGYCTELGTLSFLLPLYPSTQLFIPRIPDDMELATTAVEYTLDTASPIGMFNTIYTPEFRGSVDDFFLVIGGYYTAPGATDNTSTLSWYKINWSTPEVPLTNYESRRNWKHIVQIEAINGPGYTTAAEAAEGETDSQLLNLNIIPWDLSRTTTSIEGEYYLSVSSDEFELSNDGRDDVTFGDNIIEIFTDYSGGWVLDNISSGDNGDALWLGASMTSGPANQTSRVGIVTQQNNTGLVRTGYLRFKAGRWSRTVKVTQLTTSDFTIEASHTEYTFPLEGGSFDITITTNLPGVPRMEYYGNWNSANGSYDNWFTCTFSEDGRTLTVTAEVNTGDSRSGGIYLYAGSEDVYIYLTQAGVGVRAPQGVIGYYVGGDTPGELTLAGDDGNDTNGIVYVAYFKFGSLIATDGGDYTFSSNNIVAVPSEASGFPHTLEEYKAEITGTGSTAWAMIKDAGNAGGVTLAQGDNITTKLGNTFVADGIGDPCAHYFTDYRLPTAVENVRFVGGAATGDANHTLWQIWQPTSSHGSIYYYDPQQSSSDYYGNFDYWNHNGATPKGTATDPNTGSFPVEANETYSPGVAAFSQVLPAAGYRYGNEGYLSSKGYYGYYWSSTAYSNTSGYNLYLSQWDLRPAQTSNYGTGLAVRCVGTATQGSNFEGGENHVLYFTGDPDRPLAVGRWETSLSDEDIADGDIAVISDRTALAYFKFGSVIGFTANDSWSNDDIKFNPSAFEVGASSISYSTVPGFTSTDYTTNGIRNVSASGYHNEANILAGKGDPCKLAGMDITQKSVPGYLVNYDSGWRLPTLEENRMFIGIPADYTNTTEFGTSSGYYQVSSPNSGSWSGSNPGTGVFPLNTARDEKPHLPAAGYRLNSTGEKNSQGNTGYYWSSSACDSAGSGYLLDFNYSSIKLSHYSVSNYGYNVRCIRDTE